jgi:hypothetical protein
VAMQPSLSDQERDWGYVTAAWKFAAGRDSHSISKSDSVPFARSPRTPYLGRWREGWLPIGQVGSSDCPKSPVVCQINYARLALTRISPATIAVRMARQGDSAATARKKEPVRSAGWLYSGSSTQGADTLIPCDKDIADRQIGRGPEIEVPRVPLMPVALLLNRALVDGAGVAHHGGVRASGRQWEARTMKAIDRRLSKLEDRLVLSKELFLVVLSDAVKRGLDDDTCVDILRDGGFLPAGGVATVESTQIPGGPNAEETKRFVRENGTQICGSRVGGPGTGRTIAFSPNHILGHAAIVGGCFDRGRPSGTPR